MFHPPAAIHHIVEDTEDRVLVTHRSHTVPQLVPGLIELMGGAPVTDVVGVAVVEPINK